MNLIHIDAQWPKAFKQLDLDSTKAHLMIQKGVNGDAAALIKSC